MELDLEFDLYDYDLNNVIASNQPGSMFAQNTYYDFYDFDEDEDLGTITPTPSQSGNRIDLQRAEEFEMTKLLSNNHKEEGNTKIVQDVMGCEVVMRRNKNIYKTQKPNKTGTTVTIRWH